MAYTTPVLVHCDGANESTSFPNDNTSGPTFTAFNVHVFTGYYQFGTGGALQWSDNGAVISANAITLDGDFSMESWWSAPSGTGYIMCVGDATLDTHTIAVSQNGSDIRLHIDDGGAGTAVATGVGALPSNVLRAIGVFRQGSTIKVYVDGALVITYTSSVAFSGPPSFLGRLSGGGYMVGGSIVNTIFDEFRITKGLARQTANYTPATAAFVLDSGSTGPTVPVSLHMNGTNGALTFDNSNTAGPTFTRGGGAALTTALNLFGGACGSFLGNSYLRSNTPLSFPGDFTIAMAVKRNDYYNKLLSIGEEDAAGSFSIGTSTSTLGMKLEASPSDVITGTGNPLGAPGDGFRWLIVQRLSGTLRVLTGDASANLTQIGAYSYAGTISGTLVIGGKLLAGGTVEATSCDCYLDEVLVCSDTCLFTTSAGPTAEFSYYPYVSPPPGGGSTGPQYYPQYGYSDDAFWPPGVFVVPRSNAANLQTELNNRGTVAMQKGSYGVNITINSNQHLYGLPGGGGSSVNSITIAAGASNWSVIGVAGTKTFQAGAEISRGVISCSDADLNSTGATKVNSVQVYRVGANFTIDNSGTAGYHKNMRFIFPWNQGNGGDGRKCFLFKGASGRTSTNNVIVGYAPLTCQSTPLWIEAQDKFSVFAMCLEDYNTYLDGSTEAVVVRDTARFGHMNMNGFNTQTGVMDCGADKAVLIGSAAQGTAPGKALRFKSTCSISAAWTWALDSGYTDEASGALRIRDIKIGNKYGVLQKNGTTTAPAGGEIAQVADLLQPSVGTTQAWKNPTLRAPPDPLGVNWATGRAAQPDSWSYLQGLINATPANGECIIPPGTYYIGQTLKQTQDSQTIRGQNAGQVIIVAKNDTFDVIGTNLGGNSFSSISLIDLITYGGANGFRLSEIGYMMQHSFIMGCTFRNSAGSGACIDNAYAWDNNWFEKCHFVNNAVAGIRQRGSPPAGTTEPTISYLDKNVWFRCQFIGNGLALDLASTRQNNANGWCECYFKGNTNGVADFTNFHEYPWFANCVFDSNGGAVPLNGHNSAMCYANCTFIGQSGNTSFFSSNSKAEGCTFFLGTANPSTMSIVELYPNGDFTTGNTLPQLINCTSADVSNGPVLAYPRRHSLLMVNSQFPASDNAGFSKLVSHLHYDTAGTEYPPNLGDDTISSTLGWVDSGVVLPGTRFLRDDGDSSLVVPPTDVSVALTGNAATGAVGTVLRLTSPDRSAGLSGVEATTALGTLGVIGQTDVTAALTNVVGTGAVGTVTASIVVTVPLSGVGATGAVGDVTQTGGTPVTPAPSTGSAEYEMGGRYGRRPIKPILYRVLEEKAARRAEKPTTATKRAKAAGYEDLGARLVLGDPTEAQFAALARKWQALQPGPLPQAPAADAQAYFRAAVAQQLREQHAAAVAQAQAHVAALVQAEKDRRHEEDAILALLLA